MKHQKREALSFVISIVVIVAMLFGIGAASIRPERTSPENPISETREPIVVASQLSSGSEDGNDVGGADGEDESDDEGSENENQDEEEPEEEEPEDPQEQEKPEDEQQENEPEEDDETPDQNDSSGENPEQEDANAEPDEQTTNGGDGITEGEGGGSQDGDNNQGGGVPGNGGNGAGGGGGNGTEENGESGSGGEEQEKEEEEEEEEEEKKPYLVTDLATKPISELDLVDDTLYFYAYIENAEPGMSLDIRIRNENEPANGRILRPNGIDYNTKLVLGNNFITIVMEDADGSLYTYRFLIAYLSRLANENEPEVGDEPPNIWTSLDGVDLNIPIKASPFIFLVEATTGGGAPIYSDNILVTVDAITVRDSTGYTICEYEMYFTHPNDGDFRFYNITVTAWDDAGNSAFKKYEILYQFIDVGDKIGTVTVYIDITTIGMGSLYNDVITYDLIRGQPASYTIKKHLENMGIYYEYSGSYDVGFYLSRIYAGYIGKAYHIPDNLWSKILDDDLSINIPPSMDWIGEFDYTQGSGWMYAVNGYYPGVSSSNWYLKDGDVMVIRYTLAYGKDIGGFAASGSNDGLLSSYCGSWIDDRYIPRHNFDEGVVTIEPTCTEKGECLRTCQQQGCDHTEVDELPPLGHAIQELDRLEPTESTDGYVDWHCITCGETGHDILPRTGGGGGDPDDGGNPDDGDEPDDSGDPDEGGEPDDSDE